MVTMNIKTLAGIILVLAGAALMAFKIMYKKQETVLDAGPLQLRAETEKQSKLAPIAGGVMLVGGLALLVLGKKKA